MLPPTRDYQDVNDAAAFRAEAGPIAATTAVRHPMAHCPMFFRRNGASVDLIDLYHGQSVFLICNGPSFSTIDHGQLKQPGILTFGMNNGTHLFRTHLWTCVDEPVRFMTSIWADPSIMKFIPMAHFDKPIWDTAGNRYSGQSVGDYPNVIGFRRNERFDVERWLQEETINWGNHAVLGGGRSVMLVALRICYLLGFLKVYLVGCDFQMDQNHKYWFPEERTEPAIRNNQNSYQQLIHYFTELKPRFESVGMGVFNTNPDSQLHVFPFKDLKEAVAENVIDLSASTYGMYVARPAAPDSSLPSNDPTGDIRQ